MKFSGTKNSLGEEIKEKLTKIYQGFQILKIKEFSVDSIKATGALYVSVMIDLRGKVYKKNKIETHNVRDPAGLNESVGFFMR